MKKFAVVVSSVLLATVLALPLVAQETTCDDIAFDQQAVASYPMVRDACLEIVEYEGAKFAHLEAQVLSQGTRAMLLRFKHQDGSWGPTTTITPQPGFQVVLDGQLVNPTDVPQGRQLGIYLPEGRWEVAISDADELTISEAVFAPIEFEVTAEEIPEEVDMTADPAPAEVETADAAPEEAYQAAEEAPAEEAPVEEAPAEDQSEWYWILGLAAAFIIVWFLLRRRKASREG